jgi:F0F1-type ATP synthase membrane subunit b/b'
MPLAETLIAFVAPAITKTVLKLWVGDEKLAAAGGVGIDILAKAIPELRVRNEANRQLDAIGEKAAESLQFIFETEGKSLLVDEQEAVAKLVAQTLDRAKITAELLVRKDLDPLKLAGYFISGAADELVLLPVTRVTLYRRVIEEACQSIVDMAHRLPNFTEHTFRELLRGNRVLLQAADQMLEELKRIRSQAQTDQEAESAKFETDYRRAVGRTLNKMELFGVDLAQTSKFHPLSVAYVSLEVGHSVRMPEQEEDESAIHSVETALAANRRILIKGPAGAGKTTLVRWIAVQAASRGFEGPLKDWNDAIPFVIRLRQFSSSPFPPPEAFTTLVTPTVAGTMPRGWVHQKLKSGNAVVMVDGVDEVIEARREEVHRWIKDLTDTFPEIRLIVTSRPHAVDEGWLEGDGFGEADLQPMDTTGIENFIDHWHRAVAAEVQQESEMARLTTLATTLKETLRNNRAIRRLATSPLLCGVICALHRDTNEQLPGDRVELYERCCSMLLERRDPESGLALSDYPRLTYRQKRSLLDDLAYWMIKNAWTEVSANPARDHLGTKLENLRTDTRDGVAITSENVLRFFLERSGMLREPIEGKLDFAHRTFQEFMAAQAAVDEGDFGILLNNATNPQWREVIVLGAGLARTGERRQLIMSLLERGDKNQKDRYQLHLLAAACLDTAVDLDAAVKREVEDRVQRLVPPANMHDAALLADAAGEIAVPFLRHNRRLPAQKAAACVRALGLIASLEALQAIADYADDERSTVLKEVARSADRFDGDSYAQLVAPRLNASRLPPEVAGQALVRYGVQRLKGVDKIRAVELSNPPPGALSALHKLVALKSLGLSGARVEDLSILRDLIKLESIHLKATHVIDLAPLADLADLASVSLEYFVKLPDLTPLRALAKLERLQLTISQGADLTQLQNLTRLRSLSLSGAGVTDLLPLTGLLHLQSLSLWTTAVSDFSPLHGLSSLRVLNVSGHAIKDLSMLPNGAQLRILGLWSTGVSDLSPPPRQTLLQSLRLSGTGTIDLSPLRHLTNLQSLEIWSFAISDLSPLRDLPKLRRLELRWVKVSNDEVLSLRAAKPQLEIKRSLTASEQLPADQTVR